MVSEHIFKNYTHIQLFLSLHFYLLYLLLKQNNILCKTDTIIFKTANKDVFSI